MKTQLKKLVKSGLVGAAVLGLAIGVSAWTKIKEDNSSSTTMRYWKNNQAAGQYIEISTPDFSSNCQLPNSNDCVKQSENTELPSTLPYSQATPENGVEPHPNSSSAFYD